MKKHINCHTVPDKYEYNARRVVAELLEVLNNDTAELWDSDPALANKIDITVCNKTAHINYFCPNTWEYVEQFLLWNIGFAIVSAELNQYPYYADIAEVCAERLGCEVADFEVL